MATEYTFAKGDPADVGEQRVFVRENWADAWGDAKPELYAAEVIFSVAPAIPTARIVHRYGDMKRHDQASFAVERKAHYDRQFVKIEWDVRWDGAAWQTVTWYGILQIEADEMDGTVTRGAAQRPSGLQQYTAYGLEVLLANHVIWNWHWDRDADRSLRTVWGQAPDFNAGGKGNRASTVNPSNSEFHFAEAPDDTTFWSTETIVRYLIEWQTPRDETANVDVPFDIEAADLARLPNWDEPVLRQNHQTTFSLLNQLLDRRRLLYWWLEPNDADVKLRIATGVGADFDAGPGLISANADQINLRFDFDPASRGALKLSDVDRADQVLVRGAPIRVCGSFAQGKGNWAEGWSAGDEIAYQEGASNTIPYATLDIDEQQRRNAEVRAQPDLAAVYTTWQLPDDWDRQSWNFTTDAGVDLFPTDPDDVWLPALRIEPTLPFTVDPDDEIPPLVLLQVPDDTSRWVRADQMGLTEAEIETSDEYQQFSVAVSVTPDGKGVQLRTNGAPQYALLGTSVYASMLADVDQFYGDWNAANAIFTISMRDQHYCEAFWPATPEASGVVRVVFIDAGESYQCTYVAPGTVTGVDDDGALVKHAGGFIRDDTEKLEAIAKTAWQVYGAQRKSLNMQTYRLDERITLGQYVVDIGTEEVGSTTHFQAVGTVVTQVRFVLSESFADRRESPLQEIMTGAMELDALRLAPSTKPVDPRRVGFRRPFPDRAVPEGEVPFDISRRFDNE